MRDAGGCGQAGTYDDSWIVSVTTMTAFGFVLAGVCVLMACIKADRVRTWRSNLNPSAPDIPDSAFVVARITLLVMAGLVVYANVQVMALSD
jgi:hypothetical protein